MYGYVRLHKVLCICEDCDVFQRQSFFIRKEFDVLESHCLIFCESDSVYIVLKPGPFMTCSLKLLIRLHYICYLLKSRPSVSIVWGAEEFHICFSMFLAAFWTLTILEPLILYALCRVSQFHT